MRMRDAYLSRIARKAWPYANVMIEQDDNSDAKRYVLVRDDLAPLALGAAFRDARQTLRDLVANATEAM